MPVASVRLLMATAGLTAETALRHALTEEKKAKKPSMANDE